MIVGPQLNSNWHLLEHIDKHLSQQASLSQEIRALWTIFYREISDFEVIYDGDMKKALMELFSDQTWVPLNKDAKLDHLLLRSR